MGNGLGYRYRSFKFDRRRQPILKQVSMDPAGVPI
jgi:hypothetical protein